MSPRNFLLFWKLQEIRFCEAKPNLLSFHLESGSQSEGMGLGKEKGNLEEK